MLIAFVLDVAALGAAASHAAAASCPKLQSASERAATMADLPAEIRTDLVALTGGTIKEPDVPLRMTDTPTDAERSHALVRFSQAVRVGDRWFVQFEVAEFSGVRTVSYYRGGEGLFRRFPLHRFQGPPCASIRAALEGVTTPPAAYVARP